MSSTPPPDKKIRLQAKSFPYMGVAKTYDENNQRINSLSFSTDGKQMISSNDDDAIYLYDFEKGTKLRSVNSKKYGAAHIRFAIETNCAVHSSTKIDNTIRYLSLADNRYIRYFQGHTDMVTGLSVAPKEKMFLSVSQDRTIRLWDLKSHNCVGLMNVQHNAIAAFDHESMIFAAGMNNNTIKMYDIRSFDKGPFLSFAINREDPFHWTSMKISPCGNLIMVNTASANVMLVNAFTGSVRHILNGHYNEDGIPLEASFTPDSKFVVCGSSDRRVYVWSTRDGEIVHRTDPIHETTPHIAQFNPKFYAMASAGCKIKLWCPNDDFQADGNFN